MAHHVIDGRNRARKLSSASFGGDEVSDTFKRLTVSSAMIAAVAIVIGALAVYP